MRQAHLYVVKEDGDPSLRQWALSLLIEDRMDQLPSYNQWIGQLKDKVSASTATPVSLPLTDSRTLSMVGQRQVILGQIEVMGGGGLSVLRLMFCFLS